MSCIYRLTLDEQTVLIGNDVRTVRALKAEHNIRFFVWVLSVVTGEFSIANYV
jgi:hypothetical protein